ncbi:hypothetical protein GJ496_006943 [Pomphorhynchus laevis]|nr:hypothetical protein GJ496_006943 [Pomphorhynchus laevis]
MRTAQLLNGSSSGDSGKYYCCNNTYDFDLNGCSTNWDILHRKYLPYSNHIYQKYSSKLANHLRQNILRCKAEQRRKAEITTQAVLNKQLCQVTADNRPDTYVVNQMDSSGTQVCTGTVTTPYYSVQSNFSKSFYNIRKNDITNNSMNPSPSLVSSPLPLISLSPLLKTTAASSLRLVARPIKVNNTTTSFNTALQQSSCHNVTSQIPVRYVSVYNRCSSNSSCDNTSTMSSITFQSNNGVINHLDSERKPSSITISHMNKTNNNTSNFAAAEHQHQLQRNEKFVTICNFNSAARFNSKSSSYDNKQNRRESGNCNRHLVNNEGNPGNNLLLSKIYEKPVIYKQRILVRYLKPPTPCPPPPIIVKEIRHPTTLSSMVNQKQVPTASQLIIIRQRPPLPRTPSPIVIRETPPDKPKINKYPTVIYRQIQCPDHHQQKQSHLSSSRASEEAAPSSAKKKIVIEQLPNLPPKPRPIIIEKWLPYKKVMPKVIYEQTSASNKDNISDNKTAKQIQQQGYHSIRTIKREVPRVKIIPDICQAETIKINPDEYMARYEGRLCRPDMVLKILKKLVYCS